MTEAGADGAVAVTVGVDGTITDLVFGEKVRSFPLPELSAQILSTMRRAQSGIAARVAETMAERLGDEEPEMRSRLLDNLRERFPEQGEDQVASRRVIENEDVFIPW